MTDVRRIRSMVRWAACVAGVMIVTRAAVAEMRYPDGTEYQSWEQPLTFSKSYYVDQNAAAADDTGAGDSDHPFRTVSRAAAVLQPGERVVIRAGTYRECVRPARGGTGPAQMISYEAAPGAAVVITGSDTLNDGWQPSTAAAGRGGRGGGSTEPVYVWKHDLPGSLFPDGYNPFALPSIPGDWSWLDTKKVDMGPYFRKRGLVFVDGLPLEPMEQARDLGNTPLRAWVPTPPPSSEPAGRNGLPARTPGGAIMQEIGGGPEGRFAVENTGTVLHIRVPAETSAHPLIEVTTREQAFVPAQPGLGYIRVKGLTFQHAGNGYPPPQRGLVSTAGGNHWIIEGNTIEWANGVGLDVGNGNWGGTSTQGAGQAHIIRGNTIRYCGVEGVAGMGTQNMLVEDNLIEWCGWADAERAWEAAGAKFHGARNLLFRRNVVRHIRHANGLWLDSNNSNCRIAQNVFADILTVSAAIHMEMNRNYNLIDDNIIWDVRNAEPGTPGQRGCAGSGLFIHASDRVLVAQNLIGLCDNVGIFPILRPERANAGTGSGNYIQNNIFTRCGKGAFVLLNDTNSSDGNVFTALPEQPLGYFAGDSQQWLDLTAWQTAHGWDKNSTVAPLHVEFDPDHLELTMTGAALPKVPLGPFAPLIGNDLLIRPTQDSRIAGPLSEYASASGLQKVDPRLGRSSK